MPDENVISDVRNAKEWIDKQFPTLGELGEHLRAVERAYLERTGPFASVPTERPESVQRLIDQAQDEPGRGLLDDTRAKRPV